jgi:alpha-glucosidase
MHFRSNGIDPGRDGCRVPLPWRGSDSGFGFGPDGADKPWLPQPEDWRLLTVEEQESDPESMLRLYRDMLRLRRVIAPSGADTFHWLAAEDGVLAFSRGDRFVHLTNLSRHPVELPQHDSVLLSSAPLIDGMLPADSSVWLRTPPRRAGDAAVA